MFKIVIDTNSLINASSDDYNYGNRIVEEALQGRIQVFANHQTLAENRLMVRKKINDESFLSKLNEFFGKLNLVDNKKLISIVEDPDDNKILESAVESNSDFLVTSDNHLLKIGHYENVRIVTPQGFWSLYEQETGSGWADWLGQFIKK